MDNEEAEQQDPYLQVAPPEDGSPDWSALKQGFQETIQSVQYFVDTTRANYETRFAIWNGQSSDGKKHKKATGTTEVVPWEGASDQQVFLVDEAINAYVALLMTAWRKSTLVATPIQGADAPRAKIVSQFVKWLLTSQVPNMDREVELLANFVNEKGIAVTGQFWEITQQKVLQTLKVEQMPPEMQQMLADPELKDTFVQLAQQTYDITPKRAKKLITQLIETGEASLPVNGPTVSRPIIRTFDLSENIFIHAACTDIESAPAIYRVEYYTPEQIRGFANTDGWNEDWCDDIIEKCIGQQVTMLPSQQLSLTTLNRDDLTTKYHGLCGVVYAYQRLSDEDGIPGIYCTIFNPELPADTDGDHEGYAKHGLLGYAHGQYPFVLHRREYLDRRLYSTRGLPEIGKPFQDQVKVCRDARIDASSLSVLPPLMYPQGRAPSKWGPGAQVPERRPNEYHYADRPTYDVTTTQVEEKQVANWKEYVGFVTAEGDQQTAAVKKQVAIEKFLSGMASAIRQVFSLWKQYGDEQTWFRVVGGGNTDPQLIQKGPQNEDFDFFLTYNSLTASDPENFERITTSIAQAVASFDKFGQTDYSELLTLILSSIDPSIADRIITPKAAATEKVVTEVKDTITRAAAGFNEDIKLGTPPDIGMQVIQQFASDPSVQQRLQADPGFKDRIEKLAKQFQMQQMQEVNKKIGRYGAA